MARPYRLGKRAEAVAESRERIIEAARSFLAAKEYAGLSVESVAEAAGVSRPTVYNQFESKRGIIVAVFEDIGVRIQYDRVFAAFTDPDPLRALDRNVAEHCRAWVRDAQVIRRLFALSAIDAELGALVDQFEKMRRDPYRDLVARLRKSGALQANLKDKEVATALGLLTSFLSYDHLVAEGMAQPSIIRVLTRCSRAVVSPGVD